MTERMKENNEPIGFSIYTRQDLYSDMFAPETTFDDIYKTPNDIPNEIVEVCLKNVFDDEYVSEAQVKSLEWDINKAFEKEVEQHERKEDEMLWD